MTRKRRMRCAYGGEYCLTYCDVRPVRMEAVCWRCWYEAYGRKQAVREWKKRRWWRRLIP